MYSRAPSQSKRRQDVLYTNSVLEHSGPIICEQSSSWPSKITKEAHLSFPLGEFKHQSTIPEDAKGAVVSAQPNQITAEQLHPCARNSQTRVCNVVLVYKLFVCERVCVLFPIPLSLSQPSPEKH